MNDPFAKLTPVADIAVTSSSLRDGEQLSLPQVSKSQGGQDASPHLAWEPVEGAQSYMVTCYDPDAPTMAGFWHWFVYNIPASVTELAENAGSGAADALPEGAVAGLNEMRSPTYIGSAPPAGHGPHRYFFTVSALSIPTLELPEGATPTVGQFMSRPNVIARGHIMGTWENPATE